MNNYFTDTNPFNLQGPPDWWLKKLHDFDDSLVVMPSRVGFFYRLAQRRPPDPRAHIVHQIKGDHDSNMLARYGLVPVTTIIATARWDNPLMFEDLRQRMPSRMGGAEKYEQLLLAKEQKAELDERMKRNEMLDVIAKDSLGYYKKKAGLKTSMWTPATKNVAAKPLHGQAPAIRIAGKYDSIEKHLKKPGR